MATKYSVSQGNHAFSPPSFWRLLTKPGRIGVFAMFEESCLYDIGFPDSLDYNKLAGVSLNAWTNHENSAMLGWRRSSESGLIDLTPYCHIRGRRVIGPDDSAVPVTQVRPGEWFAVWFELDWRREEITVSVQVLPDGEVIAHTFGEFKFPGWIKWVRRIGPWFGGNQTAPHTMALWMEDVTIYERDGTPVWDGRPL